MKKKTDSIITVLLHALLLLMVYIFQGVIFPFIRIGGLVPLLLPVAVSGVALYEGRYVGGICGLFAGILCDVSFNQPVGTFTVLLTTVGLGVGMLSDAFIISSFVTYYIITFAVLLVSAFVQMIPIISRPHNIPTNVILGTVFEQTLFSLILALPIWFFIRQLGKRTERLSSSSTRNERN